VKKRRFLDAARWALHRESDPSLPGGVTEIVVPPLRVRCGLAP
jgi:hypothetical protein